MIIVSFLMLFEYIYSVLRNGCCLDLNFVDQVKTKEVVKGKDTIIRMPFLSHLFKSVYHFALSRSEKMTCLVEKVCF